MTGGACAGFSTATFSIWFKELELERLTETFAYISAKENYKGEFVFNVYYKKLQNAIFETLGSRVELVIFSRDLHSENIQDTIETHINTGILPDKAFCKIQRNEKFAAESPLSEEEKKQVEDPVGTLIKSEIPAVKGEEYTFQNFIVGEANRMAHDACIAAYSDRPRWTRMALLNTAASGHFAADRSIREYADRFWHIKPIH